MFPLLQSLMLNSVMLSVLSWQGSALEKVSGPLTPQELRETLTRLVELEAKLGEVQLYRNYIERERELAHKEQANADKALELARKETELARKELAIQTERAEFYKRSFESVTKGRSKKCTFLKVISLTLIPCK